MIKRYPYKNLIWIDVLKPTQDEVIELMEEFYIHPSVANDLLTPTFKPLVDRHKDFIYLILHFPDLQRTHSNEPNQEIDFIIGKNFIITSHYEVVDPLEKFSKEFEVSSILDKESIGDHAGYIFTLLMNKLYSAIGHKIDFIDDSLERIEDMIFSGEEKKMVKEISNIGRDLLNLKQATNTHEETLISLQNTGEDFFGEDFFALMKKVINNYHKIRHGLEIHRESLRELRDTNDSLLSTKQNETMTVLTIMAFVTFPLSLIATIFGMNTVHMPIIGSENDFWMVLSLMLMLTMIMFFFFKYKKWL